MRMKHKGCKDTFFQLKTSLKHHSETVKNSKIAKGGVHLHVRTVVGKSIVKKYKGYTK